MPKKGGEYQYHAVASAGSIILGRPVRASTGPLVLSTLPSGGGCVSSLGTGISFQDIVRFDESRSQVMGSQDPRHGVFHTSAVACIEKLNVLEFLTADRLTARLSVAHDVARQRLYVSLGGLQFDNLAIGGERVSIEQPGDDKVASFPPFSYPHVDQRSFGRIRFGLMKRGEKAGSYSVDVLRIELGADLEREESSELADWGLYGSAAEGVLTFGSVSVAVPATGKTSEKVGTRIPPGPIPFKKGF